MYKFDRTSVTKIHCIYFVAMSLAYMPLLHVWPVLDALSQSSLPTLYYISPKTEAIQKLKECNHTNPLESIINNSGLFIFLPIPSYHQNLINPHSVIFTQTLCLLKFV